MSHANVVQGDILQLLVERFQHGLVSIFLLLNEAPEVLRAALSAVVAIATPKPGHKWSDWIRASSTSIRISFRGVVGLLLYSVGMC